MQRTPHFPDHTSNYLLRRLLLIIFNQSKRLIERLQLISLSFCRHILHFVEDADDENWEKKSVIVYHVDLIFQSIIHGIDLLHHLHMLVSSNIL